MAYVAAKGGEHAIEQAEKLFQTLKGEVTRELVEQIETGLPMLIDRIMGEASLYAPQLAALALAQTGGELYEATLHLRAFRSTQPRLAYAEPVTPNSMVTVRRISAAFKDIPGGQILGPTLDYSHRILNTEILDGAEHSTDKVQPAEKPAEKTYPLVADWLRHQDMVAAKPQGLAQQASQIPDLTRGPMLFPAPREHRLQALARADTGGILTLGYANMRGYGAIHPTVNEVRLAYAEVQIKHPVTGAVFSIGRVRVSQAEIVTHVKEDDGRPRLGIGFSATLGWNEVKTIAASMLDFAMDQEEPHPAHKEEFVLYHTEVIESSGFCIHFKLPHYVTFSSSLDAYRRAFDSMGTKDDPGLSPMQPSMQPVGESK